MTFHPIRLLHCGCHTVKGGHNYHITQLRLFTEEWADKQRPTTLFHQKDNQLVFLNDGELIEAYNANIPAATEFARFAREDATFLAFGTQGLVVAGNDEERVGLYLSPSPTDASDCVVGDSPYTDGGFLAPPAVHPGIYYVTRGGML